MKKVLIYGSYGYSGNLIVEQAVKEGVQLILAGRNEKKLQAQAERFKVEYRIFSLDDTTALDSALQEVDAVLHCAGPFSLTHRQMVEACIRKKKHYMDISGEIEGFEAMTKLDEEALQAGIMLLPGCGFDVVPSDCLLTYVAESLPNASELNLYIKNIGSGVSRGTARSGIENSHRQGRIRRDGKIVSVPNVWDSKMMDFGQGSSRVVSIGWGDVSSAYYSTGVKHITAYMGFPKIMVGAMYLTRFIGPILYTRTAKNFIKWLIGIIIPNGPSTEKNQSGVGQIIAEAKDGTKVFRSRLRTPEPYYLTSLTSVEIMKRVLAGNLKPGFQTPSKVYGVDFIFQFPGVIREDME